MLVSEYPETLMVVANYCCPSMVEFDNGNPISDTVNCLTFGHNMKVAQISSYFFVFLDSFPWFALKMLLHGPRDYLLADQPKECMSSMVRMFTENIRSLAIHMNIFEVYERDFLDAFSNSNQRFTYLPAMSCPQRIVHPSHVYKPQTITNHLSQITHKKT